MDVAYLGKQAAGSFGDIRELTFEEYSQLITGFNELTIQEEAQMKKSKNKHGI